MLADLVDLLLQAGLLQFGRFANGDGWRPYQLNLGLLPSYPDILAQIVEAAAPLVGEVDHLVCPLAALPFGVSLSQATRVPLVYSRDTEDAAVYNLVGAYDIGHPALLVNLTSRSLPDSESLIKQARRVGLEIDRALVLIDEGGDGPNELDVQALLYLPEVVERLVATGRLPAAHGQRVQDWIRRHHPD